MNEFDVVRVVQLLTPDRRSDGSEGVARPPQLGDVGVIVHVYSKDGMISGYIVECLAKNGYTIWLADFVPEELELVEKVATRS
jgi:hypothetical protein